MNMNLLILNLVWQLYPRQWAIGWRPEKRLKDLGLYDHPLYLATEAQQACHHC